MDRTTGVIPGLSEQAEHVLRMVVREEVAAGIKDAFENPICPRPCERVAELEAAEYGNGAPGTKTRVTTLEEQVAALVWQTRLIAGGTVTAIAGLIVSIATGGKL